MLNMRKTIIIEILLIFVFAVLLSCAFKLIDYAVDVSNTLDLLPYLGLEDNQRTELTNQYQGFMTTALCFGIPALLAAITTVAVMAIIAIHDFPVFKPLADKIKAKCVARKERRAAEKIERDQAKKQERIARLQSELDELKKDE